MPAIATAESVKAQLTTDVLSAIETQLVNEGISRKEFYELITPEDKAEYINGVVVFHSPVRMEHLDASENLHWHLSNHLRSHKLGGKLFTEKAMIELTRNSYEPDFVYFSPQKADNFEKGQLLFPAPDFIIEILSRSTQMNDRGIKKLDYADHGVLEYWIVDPEAKTIAQHLLPEGANAYPAPTLFTGEDALTAKAIPGLQLTPSQIFG